MFDAASTRAGDYLVRADGAIWFVAAQLPMQAPLCVRTLRRLSFTRPSGPVGAGANAYGGVDRSAASGVLTNWPAAMATPGTKGQIELATATTLPQAMWSVLLPPVEWLGLLPGDTMTDDLGRAGVVEAAECTGSGLAAGGATGGVLRRAALRAPACAARHGHNGTARSTAAESSSEGKQ